MRILIPTRNSAGWIASIAEGYRALGVRPFYLVDARSDDATLAILRERGEDCATFLPSGDFVEAGMIEAGASHIEDDWILRLDDDEFPCTALATFSDAALDPGAIYGIPRLEAILLNGEVRTARWPTDLCGHKGKVGVWTQYRLFNRRAARFDNRIHTPGVHAERKEQLPADLFIVHFNCVIRSATARLAKVRGYALKNAELAWYVSDEALPELAKEHANVATLPDSAMRDVAARLPHAPAESPCLTAEELALRRKLAVDNGPGMAGLLPRRVQLRLAELMSTVGRATGMPSLTRRSEKIFIHLERE